MPRPRKIRLTISAHFPLKEKRDQKSEQGSEEKENFTGELMLELTLGGQ